MNLIPIPNKKGDLSGTIFVTGLNTPCRIGCNSDERRMWQPLLIDISCSVDMSVVTTSDNRRDCVDYCALHDIALKLTNKKVYRLLENLAYQIARSALKLQHVLSVTVSIRKPHKLVSCESVGTTLTTSSGGR